MTMNNQPSDNGRKPKALGVKSCWTVNLITIPYFLHIKAVAYTFYVPSGSFYVLLTRRGTLSLLVERYR